MGAQVSAEEKFDGPTRDVRGVLLEAVERGRKKISPVKIRQAKNLNRGRKLQRFLSLPLSLSRRFRSVQPEETSTAGLNVENLEYCTEEGPQGWVPLRIIRPRWKKGQPPLPAVVLLHPTGFSKDLMKDFQVKFARAGYFTASIDCRYHGDRCLPKDKPRSCYQDALVRAWKTGCERPFLLDNVWDILHLLDYLETRSDVDMSRVGMTGISLGGMHTWLCAALDDRVACAAPMIGVQGFKWAIEHDEYHARVKSIPKVFEAAREDMGKSDLDRDVVTAVWERIIPGLLDSYDVPFSLPLIAPRPLLIVNGELDGRCPIDAVEAAVESTRSAYLERPGDLQFYVEMGVGHDITTGMKHAVEQWMDRHLLGTPKQYSIE